MKTRAKRERQDWPFVYVPMPAAYPGKALWWTLRFAGPAPQGPVKPAMCERLGLVWAKDNPSEWVEPASLQVGDLALGGRLVAVQEISGARFWKVELGAHGVGMPAQARGTRYVSLASLTEQRVERALPGTSNTVQLEFEAEPETFDEEAFEQYLLSIHAQHPLSAVLFQEGQFLAGESLSHLDDQQLLTRLLEAPAHQGIENNGASERSRRKK